MNRIDRDMISQRCVRKHSKTNVASMCGEWVRYLWTDFATVHKLALFSLDIVFECVSSRIESVPVWRMLFASVVLNFLVANSRLLSCRDCDGQRWIQQQQAASVSSAAIPSTGGSHDVGAIFKVAARWRHASNEHRSLHGRVLLKA